MAGGSPAERPISRWAIATRVSESIISTTSLPASRKDSAIRVATKAERSRSTGGASEVATTSTDRASPSGPRSFSMNSRTSRPRSPTRAMTETSASVPRAIIDSRLDLPTPEPAMMPILWPRPQGTSESRARTPSPSWRVMVGRDRASGASPSTSTRDMPGSAPRWGPPSMGRPSPSRTRPRSASWGSSAGSGTTVTPWAASAARSGWAATCGASRTVTGRPCGSAASTRRTTSATGSSAPASSRPTSASVSSPARASAWSSTSASVVDTCWANCAAARCSAASACSCSACRRASASRVAASSSARCAAASVAASRRPSAQPVA